MNMKRHILFLLLLVTVSAVAQPPARRRAQAAQASEKPQPSAYRDFPTAQAMPEDAAWRRDLYREIDLSKEANAVLYFPTVPQDGRMSLFTYLFKLVLRGEVKAYDYKLDMKEDFSETNIVKGKELMDRYNIFYEEKDGKVRVNDADIPSDEVCYYFIKESVYYDQHTASFRSRITALCPVLKRGGDDFGGADSKYPMFWVKYDDVAPKLSKLMLMGSSLNNAATMSADDFFTLGRYQGDIYKTTNLQDRLLANYCETDTALTRERNRIEQELRDFETHVWGNDSTAAERTDSVAADSAVVKEKPKRTSRRASAASGSDTPEKKTKVKRTKTRSSSSGSARSGSGFSVRRQRR